MGPQQEKNTESKNKGFVQNPNFIPFRELVKVKGKGRVPPTPKEWKEIRRKRKKRRGAREKEIIEGEGGGGKKREKIL